MKKKICFLLGIIFSLSFACAFNNFMNVNAEERVSDVVNYVSLGDSIAAGCMLPSHTQSAEAELVDDIYVPGIFVEGSYSNLLRSNLIIEYGDQNVNAVSFAKSGDRTENLLEKLDNDSVANAIRNADVVTICIGANDILGPALENLETFIYGDMSLEEMEQALDEGLTKFAGTNDEDGNFEKILNKLLSLNSEAKYIFTNVYNPFKYAAVPTSLESLAPYVGISVDNVNSIAEATEVYVAGGENSSGSAVKGLNALLQEKILEFNNKTNMDYRLVDIKSEFDKYTLQTETKYTELVNCILTKYAQIVLDFGLDIYAQIQQYADPHPTLKGHSIINDKFMEGLANFPSVNFDYCEGGVSGKKNKIIFVNKGETINEVNAPIRHGYNFAGWYKNVEYTQKWNFTTDSVSKNTTLYAKWEPQTYTITYKDMGNESFTGSFDGGYPEEHVYDTETTLVVPTRGGYNFMGWYLTSSCSGTQITKLNNNNCTTNITIYAKWEEIPVVTYTVTFNTNGGSLVSPITVEAGKMVSEPVLPIKAGSENIFAGWYYNDEIWNFANPVNKDITLKAKWVGLVCENANDAIQIINDMRIVQFRIDVNSLSILWYVDNILMDENIGQNSFNFLPEQKVGTYQVHCVVNGVSSEKYGVQIKYAIPTQINIYLEMSDDNLYFFTISNRNYYNPDNFVWYVTENQLSEDVKRVGTGTTCKIKLDATSNIYVLYESAEIKEPIKSNIISVFTGDKVGNLIYIILAVGGAVLGFVILITIISKRRYRNYY